MSFSKPFRVRLLLGMLALLVAACGSTGGVNDISGQHGNTPNQTFPGAYLGANNLGAQTAALSLTVANNGQATGTVTVTDVTAQAIDLNPGVYDITGSVDLSTGAMNLSGNFPGVGPFSITGTLPRGTNQGSYSMTVNGQSFAGVIQNASQGAPNPPGGTGTGTGTGTSGTTGTTNGTTGTTGGTGGAGGTTGTTGGGTTTTGGASGETHLIQGGALSNFSFQPGANYNGVNPPVTASSMIGGVVLHGSATENTVTVSISDLTLATPPTVRTLVFGVVLHNGQDLEVGKTYDLVSQHDGDGALLSLSEGVGTDISSAWAATAGSSSGTVTIVALSETGVTLNFNFSNVIVNSEVVNNAATGSFAVSGTLTAQFAPSVP